jgi:hypothetical protein
MINRPATRIELKLEDDICEYEEMCEMRRNNTEMNQNMKVDNFLLEESSFNSIQNTINIQNNNLMKNNTFSNNTNYNKRNNEEDSISKSSYISMK